MSFNRNYFVYIVECIDGFYYTGVTNDVDARIDEHNEGAYPKSFMFKRRPVTLRYWLRFSDINQAIAFEKQVKGWSRKKERSIFNEDWEEIKRLAKNRSHPSTGSDLTSLPMRGVSP
jgi:putative endonuclease